jgi:TPR repeat protein
VEINPAKAFECYLKGDARKVPMCSNEVGDCYEKGFGVDKDMYKAVEHWRKAARGGDPEAKESLAHHGHPVSGLPV